MTGYKKLCLGVMALLLTGCSGIDCSGLSAKNIQRYEEGIIFEIDKKDGSYWGDFALYSADHSLSHSSNSFEKFRTPISKLDFVKYIPNADATGCLVIKWQDEPKDFCLTTIPEDYWAQILDLVQDWPEERKFMTSSGQP